MCCSQQSARMVRKSHFATKEIFGRWLPQEDGLTDSLCMKDMTRTLDGVQTGSTLRFKVTVTGTMISTR